MAPEVVPELLKLLANLKNVADPVATVPSIKLLVESIVYLCDCPDCNSEYSPEFSGMPSVSVVAYSPDLADSIIYQGVLPVTVEAA